MDIEILNNIKSRFTYPPQNWDKLLSLWKNNKPISFYSWECPPRQINVDKENGRWVNFDIDITSVVEGKKLDRYTELPRITSQWKKEKWFIEIVNKNPNCTYTKIIADTNALYIYQKSKEILGERKITYLSNKFKTHLERKSKKLLGPNTPKFMLYTSLQKKFKNEYDIFFDLVYENIAEIIPKELLDYWMDRMIRHVGLLDNDISERIDTQKRIVASYASEGVLFELLNKTKG